jgi:hypothetical protein
MNTGSIISSADMDHGQRLQNRNDAYCRSKINSKKKAIKNAELALGNTRQVFIINMSDQPFAT